jgi:hypothetical protein
MTNAARTTTTIPEAHDAPRASPPAPAVNEPEAAIGPEPLDAALDNPYDNLACTD